MEAHRRAVELRPNSRVAFYAVIALCLASCAGQAITYYAADSYDQFNVGVFFVIIASGLAGIVSSLGGYPFSQFDNGKWGARKPSAEVSGDERTLIRGLAYCAAGVAVQIVVGEILAVVALASTAADDPSILLGPILLGLLGGGTCLLLGWVTGLLVLWPILALLGMLRQRISGKPVNEALGAVSVLSLTVIAFAITGVLGIGSADDGIVGTPRGRGLAEIIILLTRYSGSPAEQALSWVARALLVGIVLEILWLRHIYLLRKRANALTTQSGG